MRDKGASRAYARSTFLRYGKCLGRVGEECNGKDSIFNRTFYRRESGD